MILTVTLNAAIDKTYIVPKFPIGEATRAGRPLVHPGGKGINVARVVRQFGMPSLATGFVGGKNGEAITDMLSDLDVGHDFVRVAGGESRLCLTIIDEASGQATELLEPGPPVTAQELSELKRKVELGARRSKVAVFSGSIPEGIPSSVYRELIAAAQAAGCLTILDTSGDGLVQGIAAKPFLIKPNEHEVARLLGKPLEREVELYPLLARLLAQGIACAVVSLGAQGCIAAHNGTLYKVPAPRIRAVNTVGCGDSFVGALAVQLASGASMERALVQAAAAGAADALTFEAGFVRVEDVKRLAQEISVIRL
ncbi:1-phosphofructokinase family hexose kinase [Paenibacillus doosanensis]|uniref:1-phosphofructokinase family hexose kinase n=1 Tax=Paenibacillus doosanensis TaxID=1229154 RepID=UPI00217FCCD0|nr:1-phosphofructokinase family hexose kinase [Paenibacillus doosanensis]MCS7460149.1 1-phosphofructokinase family hexose kinase [Paenibacillus doosanensis]